MKWTKDEWGWRYGETDYFAVNVAASDSRPIWQVRKGEEFLDLPDYSDGYRRCEPTREFAGYAIEAEMKRRGEWRDE